MVFLINKIGTFVLCHVIVFAIATFPTNEKCPRRFGAISGSTFIRINAQSDIRCTLHIRTTTTVGSRIRILFREGATNAQQSRLDILGGNMTKAFNITGIAGKEYSTWNSQITLIILSDNTTTNFRIFFRVLVVSIDKTTSAITTPTTTASTTSATITSSTTTASTTSAITTSSTTTASTTSATTTLLTITSASTTPTTTTTTKATTTASTTSTGTTSSTTTPSPTSATTASTTTSTSTTSTTTTATTTEPPTEGNMFTTQASSTMSTAFSKIEKDTCVSQSYSTRGISLSFPNTSVYHLALSDDVCQEYFGRPVGTAACTRKKVYLDRFPSGVDKAVFTAVRGVPCNVTFSSLISLISNETVADLVVLTSAPSLLSPQNITVAIDIIEGASKKLDASQIDEKLIRDVTNTISNVANGAIQQEEKLSSSTSGRLLDNLNRFVYRSPSEHLDVITPDIEVQSVRESTSAKESSGRINNQFTFLRSSSTNNNGDLVAISNYSTSQSTLNGSNIYTVFADGSLFTRKLQCISHVLALGTTNSNVTHLTFTMSFGDIYQADCVQSLANFNKTRVGPPTRCSLGELKRLSGSNWVKDKSCSLSSEGNYNCQNPGTFAIFFSSNRIPHALELSIFTYIGCGISVVFLLATIMIHLVYRDARKKATTTFQINICFCLLSLYLFFAIGITMTSNGLTCDIMAFAIHFFVLATFAWMSANSYKMIRIFAKFTYDVRSHLTLVHFICYGLPLVIALTNFLVTLIYSDRLHKDPNAIVLTEECKTNGSDEVSHACWLHGDSQVYGFLLPIGISLLFNLIIFILLLKIVIFRKKTIRSTRKARKARVKLINALTMATMMGLTWIFGFFLLFSEDEIYQSIFQWLFCIINTLLGILIFYLSCLRRNDVKAIWLPQTVRSLNRSRKSTYALHSSQSSQYNGSSYRKKNNIDSSTSNFERSVYKRKDTTFR